MLTPKMLTPKSLVLVVTMFAWHLENLVVTMFAWHALCPKVLTPESLVVIMFAWHHESLVVTMFARQAL